MIITFVAQLLFLAICVAYGAYLWESFRHKRPGKVIYVSSDLVEQGKILEKIITKYVPNTAEVSLIEPGAGLGRVAQYLEAKFPWKEVVAIECGKVILTGGRIRSWFIRSRVKFVECDLFAYSYPNSSVIYCYLTSDIVTEMHKKGLLKGCLVIVLTFEIRGIEPTEIIPLTGWQKAFRIYDFR